MKGYYDAREVDALLEKSASIADGLADVIKEQYTTIGNLEKELSLVRAASANNVTLEKVASASPLTREEATGFAQLMASHALISEDSVEKYANAMLGNPKALLKFATTAIKSSELPSSQGRGISKSAGKTAMEAALERENRLWAKAATIPED